MVERAELVVSELVTNAIRHGRTAPHLLLVLAGECLRIEVTDAGSGGAVRRHPRPEDVGGRGLFLVDAISDRWGSAHEGGHHIVWCEMAL